MYMNTFTCVHLPGPLLRREPGRAVGVWNQGRPMQAYAARKLGSHRARNIKLGRDLAQGCFVSLLQGPDVHFHWKAFNAHKAGQHALATSV